MLDTNKTWDLLVVGGGNAALRNFNLNDKLVNGSRARAQGHATSLKVVASDGGGYALHLTAHHRRGGGGALITRACARFRCCCCAAPARCAAR